MTERHSRTQSTFLCLAPLCPISTRPHLEGVDDTIGGYAAQDDLRELRRTRPEAEELEGDSILEEDQSGFDSAAWLPPVFATVDWYLGGAGDRREARRGPVPDDRLLRLL